MFSNSDQEISEKLQRQLVDQFGTAFKQQAGSVYMVKTTENAAKIVDKIVAEKSAGKVYCAPFSIDGKRFDSLLESEFLTFEELIRSGIKDDALRELGALDVGITLSQWAISQTGSLVEVCSSDNERLLSSLSRIHISILEASNILENLLDIAPMLRSSLSAERKPTITFIGGPSRTSDIELKSVLGVHGPHEVHAVIIG